MKPTHRLILLALIILIFGVVPRAPAAVIPVNCDESPQNGFIDQQNPEDFYEIYLVAGQKLTIDVDAEKIKSPLDSVLEVFAFDGTLIGLSEDSDDVPPDSMEPTSEDPYLEITVDVDGTYTIAISASTPGGGADTGPYTLLFNCSDPSTDPVKPVEVGYLLGATGSYPGLLLDVIPANAQSFFRFTFPSEIGLIADIEYDHSSKMLFVATDIDNHGRIVTINPDDGKIGAVFDYANECGFIALESAGDTLYGVYASNSSGEQYSLVTINRENGEFAPVETSEKINSPIWSLAHHSLENALYGVSGSALIKIDLKSSPFKIDTVHATGFNNVFALDFSHKDILYGVDGSGNLFNLPELNTNAIKVINPIDAYGGVKGLTFVVGEAPPDVEPVKTLCSSTLISATNASSETDVRKLSKLKLKNNPLHRAIGLFKFKGRAGETVTLKLAPAVEEAVETGEDYTVSTLAESWLKCKGQGRVFLGIRDAIPNVDFRARKKDQIPFDMSTDLPEDGYYYVMVIRPLLRFYQTDYCLTLESDDPYSEAWQSLDVVLPGDDAEEDTTLSTAETRLAEPLSFEADLVDAGTDDEPESSDTITELTTFSSEPTNTNLTAEVTPAEELTTEATEESTMVGAPEITEETTVDEKTAEVVPQETPAEITEESTMVDAPEIAEETTVNVTDEVAPEESADEISGDDESAEGGTSDLFEQEPTEASTP
jgi:hypothetical protein